MTDTKTQSWCPTCGQNERASEYLSDYVKKLSQLQDKYIKDIEEKDQRIGELERAVEYLEDLIEWCDCKNPKIDCICPDKNGWHTSKVYKLEQTILRMAEGIEFYADEENYYAQTRNLIDSPMRDGCGNKARAIQKETAEVVAKIRGGE